MENPTAYPEKTHNHENRPHTPSQVDGDVPSHSSHLPHYQHTPQPHQSNLPLHPQPFYAHQPAPPHLELQPLHPSHHSPHHTHQLTPQDQTPQQPHLDTQTQPQNYSSKHSSHHHSSHPHHYKSTREPHTYSSHQPHRPFKSLRLSTDAAADDFLSGNKQPSNNQQSPTQHHKHSTEKLQNATPATDKEADSLAGKNDRQAFLPQQLFLPTSSDFHKSQQQHPTSKTHQHKAEETPNLTSSKSNLNSDVENKLTIKPKSSPSLDLISDDQNKTTSSNFEEKTSLPQSTHHTSQSSGLHKAPHHSLTSTQRIKLKKLKEEKRRKRFLWFSFFLSMLATILWLVVFCCNGWFTREFPTKRYFNYIDQTHSKRHTHQLAKQQHNKLQAMDSTDLSNVVEGRLAQELQSRSRRYIKKKRLTLSAQYGGIWRMCSAYKEMTETRCSLLEQYPSKEASKAKANSIDVITFRRSCGAMGIISIVILILTNSFVYYSIVEHRYVYKRLSGSLLIGGAACILVCIEIFQGLLAREQEQVYQQTTASLGPCYILAWVCMIILLVSSAILFYHSRKQKYDSVHDRPVIIGRF